MYSHTVVPANIDKNVHTNKFIVAIYIYFDKAAYSFSSVMMMRLV